MAYLSLCERVEFLHHYLFHNLQIKQQDVGMPAQIVPEQPYNFSLYAVHQSAQGTQYITSLVPRLLSSCLYTMQLKSEKGGFGNEAIIVHHFSMRSTQSISLLYR